MSTSTKKTLPAQKPRAVGRPTKYNPDYNKQVEKLCKLSATDAEIADFFEVDVATIQRWKIAEPEFCDSIKRGKIIADAEVSEKLYQRACGYEHPEVELKVVSRGDNQGSEVERHDVIKHYPPDTAAAFIWLKNRRGWKDKVELTGDIGIIPKAIQIINPYDLSTQKKEETNGPGKN